MSWLSDFDKSGPKWEGNIEDLAVQKNMDEFLESLKNNNLRQKVEPETIRQLELLMIHLCKQEKILVKESNQEGENKARLARVRKLFIKTKDRYIRLLNQFNWSKNNKA